MLGYQDPQEQEEYAVFHGLEEHFFIDTGTALVPKTRVDMDDDQGPDFTLHMWRNLSD